MVADVGAVVWADGTTGITGPVSTMPALRGSQAGDSVGWVAHALPGGRYAVHSPFWDAGAIADAGAVTWMAGGGPVAATVTTANSLHGTQTDDRIGYCNCAAPQRITQLTDGNLVIASPEWDLGGAADAGAITWFAADGSTTGAVSPAKSLHGTHAGDQLGIEDGPPGRPHDRPAVVDIGGGNALVVGYRWDDGNTADAGAVTLFLGQHQTVGPIHAGNSVIGAGTIGPPGTRLTSDAAAVVPSGANRAFLLRLDGSPFFTSAPPDVTATAPFGQNATVVTFTLPVASDQRSTPTVTCEPASGTPFAVGTTTVQCTATDSVGLTDTTSFDVLVEAAPDEPPILPTAPPDEPPILPTAPPDVSVTAPFGQNTTVVTFALPVASDLRSTPTVTCVPASGSSFPIGTTTVTCTATDSVGLTAATSFRVVVTATGVTQPITGGQPAQRCSMASC